MKILKKEKEREKEKENKQETKRQIFLKNRERK
jgi:hypothetical protein